MDGAGNIYVINFGANSITVYTAGASGNTAPIATIVGANTGLDAPASVAVDRAGKIYAASRGTYNRITVYAAGASGNATPIATISGPSAGLYGPSGVALQR